ncbi:MAG: transcriptional regulator [Proteobacteria bacterium]|nr:transcriptional regulator [Pseudomonadota bacterium]
MKREKTYEPKEREITVRSEIIELLKLKELTTLEISRLVRIPEKSVSEHIEHIRRGLQNKGYYLKIIPAVCLSCGFVFKKRDKIKPPTRCPLCKSEHIQDSTFKILPLE